MNKLIIKLSIIFSTFFLLTTYTNIASASVIWAWSFPENNISLTPTETFYIGGTVYNNSVSTENLVIGGFSWWVSGGDLGNSDFFGGLYTYNSTSNVTGGLFENSQDAVIAPGDSYTFTIANFAPILPISVGTQFSWTIQLFNNLYEPTEGSITKTINATIVPFAVPSSTSLLLILSGLFSLAVTSKKFK